MNGLTQRLLLHFRDSVYVAASNVVKNRLVADDLFVYKVNDSSVALSPQSDRKLDPCEIIGLLMLIYKGNSEGFELSSRDVAISILLGSFVTDYNFLPATPQSSQIVHQTFLFGPLV